MAASESTYAIEAGIIQKINRLNQLYYDCLNGCSVSTRNEWSTLIRDVNNDVNRLKNELPESEPGNLKNYTDILNKYKEIQDIRDEMSNKIDDIKETNTVSHTSNIKLLSSTTLYENLGWSLLATTVLYYVFMKVSK